MYQNNTFRRAYAFQNSGFQDRRVFNAPQYQNNGRAYNPVAIAPQKRKHSGAKKAVTLAKDKKTSVEYLHGWIFRRGMGLVTIAIFPYKNSDVEHKSGSGRKYVSMMAKLRFHNSGIEDHYPVLVDNATGKAMLQKHGWIFNPSAPNGGYVGPTAKK